MAPYEPSSSTRAVRMDVESVLHMNGGLGETGYALNSSLQKKTLEVMKHIIVDSAVKTCVAKATRERFTIVDLGCSSGTNSLLLVGEIIRAIHERAQQWATPAPEFMVFLNDLPTNDFNSIFLTLPDFTNKLKLSVELQGGCAPSVCLSGLPGSFYGRLFPTNTLDFVCSFYSMHWLSQVPEGLVDGSGMSINKGKTYICSTSPPAVLSAYFNQFRKDFSVFLKSRSAELQFGGRIGIAMLGRESEDHSDRSTAILWDVLDQSFAILASQEMIDEEKVNEYDVPFYAPSRKEIESEVLRDGSFTIESMENYELKTSTGDPKEDARITSMAIRAIQESMISHHFGEEILDSLFQIYNGLLGEVMVKEEITSSHLLVVLKKSS
ncbi:probable methyltransferase TCM_000336 [Zingiber officinale]|uniref:Uncharacterized protein n=1 Tax=Zingiber officinale TaxID=94328 RepID=A0A8J5FH64_ZINOF|nr:probable methyltransferase TCM_000336 [Zingiber officinale]KAG6487261.1 hypothetical protein ZIOFF_055846 [Zingiber officinale]